MPNLFNNTLDKRVYIVPQNTSEGYRTGKTLGDGVELLLDANEEVSVTYGAETSSHFVNAGTDNTDQVHNQPRVINFSGIISNDLGLGDFIKNLQGESVEDKATLYHEVISSSIKKKLMFGVYIPNIGVINNCIITRCKFSTDHTKYNAFAVSMEMKEIRLPENTVGSPTEVVSDVVPAEQTKSAQTTEKVSPPADVASGSLVNPVAT